MCVRESYSKNNIHKLETIEIGNKLHTLSRESRMCGMQQGHLKVIVCSTVTIILLYT